MFMKEKINRLAKGIVDQDAVQAELLPPSFDEPVSFTESGRRELMLRSLSGDRIKGLCYSDNPRVRVENPVFFGNKNRIYLKIDPSFLKTGTVIYGKICFITSTGEFSVPYRFTAEGRSVYEEQEPEEEIRTAEYDTDAPQETEKQGLTEFEAFLCAHFPEDEELFAELCGLLIREQRTELFAFRVYEEAVKRDVKLTRLYEYYIYAVPEGFTGRIPREVLLYFSYDSTLDPHLKSVIYKNILTYLDPDSELYRHYEPEMRDYALSSVFRGRIDDKLAVIYAHMLYPDMIDERVAEILPALLKTSLIRCADSRMRKVVVRYPELRGEEVYPLREGAAYVPVYFGDAQILFLDHYGNYYQGVSYEKTAVMHKPELLARCFALNPGHPMIRLAAAKEILAKGVSNEQEREVLLDVMRSLPVKRSFFEEMIAALLTFGGPLDFIGEIDIDRLPGAQKKKIFEGFLADGETDKAYVLLRRYGLLIAEHEPLKKLCLDMIQSGTVPAEEDGERFFVSACRRIFDEGACDEALLRCLANSYEGATEDMYKILTEAEKKGVDTAALSERILITKLFAGVRRHLDETFFTYLKQEPKELLVRAYLSLRASDYFTYEAEVPEKYFRCLKDYIVQSEAYEKLPSLYLLAWTKHFAEESGAPLSEDAELAEALMKLLISEGLVFSYVKPLSKKISLPKEITENVYIEYHGDRFRKPRLMLKITPEDESFREDELRRVYQGIYLKAVKLFSDDELQYMIYDEETGGEPVQQGVISGKKQKTEDRGSRYGLLDGMTGELLSGEETKLREDMQNYLLRQAMSLALFGLQEQGVL